MTKRSSGKKAACLVGCNYIRLVRVEAVCLVGGMKTLANTVIMSRQASRIFGESCNAIDFCWLWPGGVKGVFSW